MQEEAVDHVIDSAVSNPDREDVGARECVLFNDALDATHAERIAAGVTHAVPKDDRSSA